MKQLFSLIILFCWALPAFCQKEVPAFGSVDKADLELKECDFDKGAAAMVLVEEGTMKFEPDHNLFKLSLEIRIRIKVFREKGLDFADVRIPYLSDEKYERVTEVQGYTYNLDAAGEVVKTKLEKSQVFNQKVTDEFSEVKFSLPQVKAGSVFEYRFHIYRASFSHIKSWEFQRNIPIRINRFTFEVPEYLRVTPRLLASSAMEKKQEEFGQRMYIFGSNLNPMVTRTTYTLRNVPAIKEEPFMSAMKDYTQRLEFQLSALFGPNGDLIVSYTTNWEQVAEALRNSPYFGAQLKKNVSIPELKPQLEKAITPFEKMWTVHQYCRKNFKWNGVHDYGCENVKKTAEQGSGTSGDLNLLLINLLRDADIDAVPVLASTRDNGRVNTAYPFMRQFNTVMALVNLNGREYVLDATNPWQPTQLVPHEVMTTEVLKIFKTNSEWTTLWNEKLMEKNRAAIMAQVSSQGVLEGEGFVSSFDYARLPRMKAWKEDKDGFINQFLKPAGGDMKIENLKVTNTENDSLPLEQKFNFSVKLSSSGEYSYFSLNLFNQLDKNPFLADTRYSDIDFGCNRLFSINGQVSLPEEYSFEELPKNITMRLPDSGVVFSRSFMREDNTLTFRFNLSFNRPQYFVDEYDAFREFYKKLFDMLNEQVVLRRKK